MEEKIKYEVTLQVGLAGCKRTGIIKFDKEELDGMTEDERDKHIAEVATEWANNYIDISFREVE